MNFTFKQKLAAGAAGAAVLAGAGGAYAVTKGSGGDEGRAFMNDVAGRLKVTPQQLQDAFQGALADRLAAAVKAGRLTQEQADEIKAHAKLHDGLPFPGRLRFRGGPPPPFGGPPPPAFRRGPGGPFAAGTEAAAKYLGLTRLELRRQLFSGKSLAQVAADRKKPVDGLKSAIEDAVKSELDKAVADKRITAAEEKRELTELHNRLDEIVNHEPGHGPPPGFGMRRWRHHGPPW
jgi:hypothetical protein